MAVEDSGELHTVQHARENPEAVRQFAEKCDDPLKSRLLEIVDKVEGGDSA
jgi:hypothetical protein